MVGNCGWRRWFQCRPGRRRSSRANNLSHARRWRYPIGVMIALPTDDDLLRRCRGGDHLAFGEIVNRYQGLVRALAFSACGERTRSEDIAQETFITAWKRLGDLRNVRKFRPWLCSIARSMARLAQRHASRRPEGHAEVLDELPEFPTRDLPPDENLRHLRERGADRMGCAGASSGRVERSPRALLSRGAFHGADRCGTRAR